ncbi:hypothetical protein [Pseudomonas sp. TWP3-2]|uniref:hypothetical protein n=1 Tax=Pseudomonas sp. TWP3-2 TaxID=2804574 RepID=UPI003CEAB998
MPTTLAINLPALATNEEILGVLRDTFGEEITGITRKAGDTTALVSWNVQLTRAAKPAKYNQILRIEEDLDYSVIGRR